MDRSREVTGLCRFVVSRLPIAELSSSGVATPKADGQASLLVTSGDQAAGVELRVDRFDWTRRPGFRSTLCRCLQVRLQYGACHGNLNGKGGFKLSLRGDNPTFDLQSLTHDAGGRRLSPIAPSSA